jgi:hypothetical protein
MKVISLNGFEGLCMYIFPKIIRFALYALATVFTLHSYIEAFPIAYRRLVLKKNGKTVKVIDLVCDVHIPEQDTKPNDLGESEKALLATLRKMGNRKSGQMVEVFGETSPDLLASNFPKDFINKPLYWLNTWLFGDFNPALLKITGKLYQEFNNNFESKYLPPTPVLLAPIVYFFRSQEKDPRLFLIKYIGTFIGSYAIWRTLKGLHHVVCKPKNKKLIYSHGDCYRRNIWDNEMDPLGIHQLKNSLGFGQKIIDTPVSGKILANLDRTVQKDLAKLKPKINPTEYAALQRIWSESKQTIRKESKDGVGVPLSSAMDFELIMKICNSPSKHNIIFAGADHCIKVRDDLIKHFNFRLTQSIGDDTNKVDVLKFVTDCKAKKIKTKSKEWYKRLYAEIRKINPPLPASTWKHLESTPLSAEMAYKKWR